MRTVGRRYTGNVRGDYRRDCDYCGIEWHRSDLVKDSSGKYQCPDDRGKSLLDLDRENAASGASVQPVRPARGRW